MGKRIPLAHTRAILDAIHGGVLAHAPTETDPIFGVAAVTHVPRVPEQLLVPARAWADGSAYHATASKLAAAFVANFKQFEAGVSAEVREAGPR